MRKVFTLWILLPAIMCPGFAKKIGEITDLTNPYMITISGDDMYVVEGTTIYKYDLSNLKLITKFGRKGEGPGEFFVPPRTNMGNVSINILPERIAVTSLSKLSFFTREGIFIKEIRAPFPWPDYAPIGDRYVGRGTRITDGLRYYTVKLFSRDLSRGEEICATQSWNTPGAEILPFYMIGPQYYVLKDEVYVEKDKNAVLCFDRNGKLVREIDINQGYKKVRVSDVDRNRYLEYFKTEPTFRENYLRIKKHAEFPACFPGIKFFFLADGEIYIIRWTGKDARTDMAIFSPHGKLEKSGSIRVFMKDTIAPYSFGFSNHRFYQLVENSEEEGVWELHCTEIR